MSAAVQQSQMPSANIQSNDAMNNNAITLTFNGVDFRLVPTNKTNSSGNGGISMNSANGTFTTINLEDFTGKLIVSSSPVTNSYLLSGAAATRPVSVNTKTPAKPEDRTTNTVEDEPSSPEMVVTKSQESSLPQGQKQLLFRKLNNPQKKKRSSDMKESHNAKKTCKSEQKEHESVLMGLGQPSQTQHPTSDDFDLDCFPEVAEESKILAGGSLSLEGSVSTQQKQGKEASQIEAEDVEMTRIDVPASTITEIDEEEEVDSKNHSSTLALTPMSAEVSNKSSDVADKNLPCPRWGQTVTLIEDSKVLVYGGQTLDGDKVCTLTDLHIYDLVKRSWSKPINCEGMPRTWHSATFLPERQLLISFGGEFFNEKTKKTKITDQVMVLDTEIMLWYPPSVSGAVPSGRSGHSASLLQNSNELIIFGGVKNNKWQNSLAVLDTLRWAWSVPKITGSAPRARSYHTSTPVPSSNFVVIFGGNNDQKCFDSVHVLDTSSDKWTWSHPNISGNKPRARTGHTATLLEDGKTILIHGGWDPNDETSDDELIFGDSHLLDTSTWTWKTGPKPKFSAGQRGAVNGGCKRTGASSLLAPGVDTSQVLMFGGRVPSEQTFSNDFQSFSVPHRMIGM